MKPYIYVYTKWHQLKNINLSPSLLGVVSTSCVGYLPQNAITLRDKFNQIIFKNGIGSIWTENEM